MVWALKFLDQMRSKNLINLELRGINLNYVICILKKIQKTLALNIFLKIII